MEFTNPKNKFMNANFNLDKTDGLTVFEQKALYFFKPFFTLLTVCFPDTKAYFTIRIKLLLMDRSIQLL